MAWVFTVFAGANSAPAGNSTHQHFNPTAGWVARARIFMRKPPSIAPPITAPPPDGDVLRKQLSTSAPANSVEVQEITYVIFGRPRGRK